MRVLIVGRFALGHIGASLLRASEKLGIEAIARDSDGAFAAPRWLVSLNWHLLNHRPPHLERFSSSVVELCKEHAPDVLLSTGSAPISAAALRKIGELGVHRINYSTDDPWSPVHRSKWLLSALAEYDAVFTPRRSNMKELRSLGGPAVYYLPFAFDPELHFIAADTIERSGKLASDVLFVGGADRDRVEVVQSLTQAGVNVALYGGYWERYAATRASARGIATPETIRLATYEARVSLCLVRRSNRDGHVMRSFELAALGACMLVEDTEEHREIFGADREAVLYFRTVEEMIERLQWLLAHPAERAVLSRNATARVAIHDNTYEARLSQMLLTTESLAGSITQ